MKVHHFIYTRVQAEYSPDGRAGFRIAWMPRELLGKKETGEINSNIIWNQGSRITTKNGLFFLDIGKEQWLVLLHYTDQPEAHKKFSDKVGDRDGIFLCHGFLFPEPVWRRAATPWTAMQLVADKVMTDLEQVFSSPYIELAGNETVPFDLGPEDLNRLDTPIPPPRSAGEAKISLYLLRTMRQPDRPPLLMKGHSDRVRQFMDRTSAVIPNALQPGLKWDTAMDQGNMYHYAFLSLAGYEQDRPEAGHPIEVDPDNPELVMPDDFAEPLADNPAFDNYLADAREQIDTKATLEMAWQLGLYLKEGKSELDTSLAVVPGFAEANRSRVEELFRQALAQSGFPDPGFAPFFSSVPVDRKLGLLLAGLSDQELAAQIEQSLRAHLPPPAQLRPLLTPLFLRHSGRFMHLLATLMEQGRLDATALQPLSTGETSRLADYLLAHYSSETWLLDLLKTGCPLAREIIDRHNPAPEQSQGLTSLLMLFAGRELGLDQGPAGIVAREAVARGKVTALLGSGDPLATAFSLLEEYVQSRGFDRELLAITRNQYWKSLLSASTPVTPPAPETGVISGAGKEAPATEPAGGHAVPRPDHDRTAMAPSSSRPRKGKHGGRENRSGESPQARPAMKKPAASTVSSPEPGQDRDVARTPVMPPHPHPCLYAFLEPRCPAIPEQIAGDRRLRLNLLETCIDQHRLTEGDLLARGFTLQEIEQVRPPATGLFARGSKHPGLKKDRPASRKKPGLLARLFGGGKKS